MTNQLTTSGQLLLWIIFAAAFSVGCKSLSENNVGIKIQEYKPNSQPGIEQLELSVREAAIRHHLSEFSQSTPTYIVFEVDKGWVQPPRGFVERLHGNNAVFKSIGDARISESGLYLGSSDSGAIFLVKIKRWIDDNSVLIYTELDGHPRIRSGPGAWINDCELYTYDNNLQRWTFSKIIRSE